MVTNRRDAEDTEKESGWLEIGKIVAPQGLDGEVRVYPNSDFPERFVEPGRRWLLCPGEKTPQPIELVGGRYLDGKGLYVVEIAGVEDRDRAEALRGCLLMVPESDRPPLGEDEYHVLDLVGLEVFLQESGESIGTVVDVISAGNDLLEVQLHQKDEEVAVETLHAASVQKSKVKSQNFKRVLIPFVKAIAPVVDIEAKRVEITPPSGLLELND